MPGRPGQAAKPRKTARMWWTVHQWAGLKLSLFMAFVCLTGTLAVISHEIDWLLQPDMRVSPATAEGPVAWGRIAENARHRPGVERVISIEAPIASAFAAKVMIEPAQGGDRAFLYAHPTTGEIQGTGPWVGAARVLRNTHRHLNLPTWIGVPIVSSLGFILLIAFVTSFVVYKKWWRGFFKPLRSRDARTWWGDFHRLAGVWSLWFVLLISLTSIWYFVESLGLDAPSPPRVEAAQPDASGSRTDIAAAVEAAQRLRPGLRVRNVILPNEGSEVVQVQGDYEALLVRHRANTAWVDASTGKVLLVTDGRDMTVHQRIGEMADPLHFGNFGGYWTKIPWVLFGLAMTGLSLSGAAIYSLRLSRTKERSIRITRSFVGMWNGMGRWRWLSLVMIATAFGLLPELILQYT